MARKEDIDQILENLKSKDQQETPKPQPQSSGAGSRSGNRKKKRRVGRRITNTVITLLWTAAAVVGAYFLATFLVTSAYDLLGLNQTELQVEIDVKEGDTLSDVAKKLKEKGVISHTLPFELFAKLKKDNGNFTPGQRVVNDNMSYDNMLRALKSSQQDGTDEAKIVFREGLTINQIAQMLEENRVCQAEEFIDILQEEDFGFEFEDLISKDPNRFYRLEGYIFPDTYEFYLGEAPKSVARRFLRRFNQMITPELYARMRELDMTLEDTLTLASLIQAEAGGSPEMTTVSSVFHNRLNHPESTNGQLQSDPTIFYVEKNIKPYLSITNQAMYDAYNTYVCQGLPIGPINNPGIDAIRAALYPDETEYYYFVTDDNGTFYFAATLEEHNANIAETKRINAELKQASKAESTAQ